MLRKRSTPLVRRPLVLARFLAIRAPKPLEGARLGVEDNDAAILVAVSDIEFVGLLVEHDMGRPAKSVRTVRIAGDIRLADLVEKFPSPGEGWLLYTSDA